MYLQLLDWLIEYRSEAVVQVFDCMKNEWRKVSISESADLVNFIPLNEVNKRHN